MKLHDDLKALIQEALDVRKKDGTEVFKDDDEMLVQVAGTFANDKFIVIKRHQPRQESNPDSTLKGHHAE